MFGKAERSDLRKGQSRMKEKKGKVIVTTIAVITAIVGAAVAVAVYLKKKAEAIGEKLDFDGNIYFEDDDDFYASDDSDEDASAAEDNAEEAVNEVSAESADIPEESETEDKE